MPIQLIYEPQPLIRNYRWYQRSYPDDDEHRIYLQSNYFKKPKKLFLQFNKVRVLNKNGLNVVFDPKTGKLIKAPRDGIITGVETSGEEFILKLHMKHRVIGTTTASERRRYEYGEGRNRH
ncbi:hypothetical protein JOC77_002641 [Peribacillus deserti]|uniref:Uncharacterized protein n=1 Tax=Peribacillus deserti TaxID=673318 RepID=A0ABS2QJ82_9BACI|nr:hypothetical protein [Peribacillus deserti]MBM7693201.1 hypothetical protein [Peribacillus deserti]